MAVYFAYGSNMLRERLTAECRVPDARTIGTGFVKGRRLAFHKLSSRKTGTSSGKCDIPLVDADESAVFGVLFEVADLTSLDLAEGLGKGYKREYVTVETFNGENLLAITYLASASRIDATAKPYDWYKALVREGARQNRLPFCYIKNQIASVEAKPDHSDKYLDFKDAIRILKELNAWPCS